MSNLTLLIMAAGMGSRYGGLKQLDAMGPNGETIIDYSVYDAILSGFNKVVFIIRKDFENEFKIKITDKYLDKIQVEFAIQDIHSLPTGFVCPNGREKPWGTGHAILSASNTISEPFCVINADDFYGRDAYKTIANYYTKGNISFSMVAYRLDQTLSSHGGVSRGICEIDNGYLSSIVETNNVKQSSNGITSGHNFNLDGKEPVSVNMWGFTPIIFDYLKEMFKDFVKENISNLKSEFLIPSINNDLIQSNKENIFVLNSEASWFGVTYKEDKKYVMDKIRVLINKGIYPNKLF